METTIHGQDREEDKIVIFPGKDARKQRLADLDNDPLEQLLNEFTDVEEHVELSLSELDYELELDYEDADFNLFGAYQETESEILVSNETMQNLLAQAPAAGRIGSIERKLEMLAELRSRMNYLMDEIELFMPKKRRN